MNNLEYGNEAEFQINDSPITIFKALSYLSHYPNIVYRIKNTGTSMLKVIYDSETMDLKPYNSIDLTIENKDLRIDGDYVAKGKGTYRIVYVVK